MILAGCFLLLLPDHPMLPGSTLARSLTDKIPKKGLSAGVPVGTA